MYQVSSHISSSSSSHQLEEDGTTTPPQHPPLSLPARNYMNDALRTDVFLRYSPETIACACIWLAARLRKVPLPEQPPWYLVLRVKQEHIEDVAASILRLYTRKKVRIIMIMIIMMMMMIMIIIELIQLRYIEDVAASILRLYTRKKVIIIIMIIIESIQLRHTDI